MAFLLKKNKVQTIRSELFQYLKQIFLILFLIFVTGTIFYLKTVQWVTQEKQQLFLLNDFYSNLNEEHRLLYQYVLQKNSLSYQSLKNHTDLLDRDICDLYRFHIQTAFQREIEDLSGILENYYLKIEEIRIAVLEKEETSSLNQKFYESNELYIRMQGTYQNLYQMLLQYQQSQEEIFQRNLIFFFAILCLDLFCCILYIFFCLKNIEFRIVKPIQDLTSTVKHMDLDQLELIDVSGSFHASNEEIKILLSGFDTMVKRLKLQVEERIEYISAQLKLKEQELTISKIRAQLKHSQLKNLQMQINPHFLFNTLNMISQSAYMENDFTTLKLLKTTASLLRYTLDYSNKAVTLEHEIEMLGNYITLQEERFGNRIQFKFYLDECFHQVLIPNLILQPLVENSIMHGVGMYLEGGKIFIQTIYDPDHHQGIIRIADNGEGISPEKLETVIGRMKSSTEATGKIGLSNVYLRLQLFFNQKAKIEIASIPKEQTSISIIIPVEENVLCIKS